MIMQNPSFRFMMSLLYYYYYYLSFFCVIPLLYCGFLLHHFCLERLWWNTFFSNKITDIGCDMCNVLEKMIIFDWLIFFFFLFYLWIRHDLLCFYVSLKFHLSISLFFALSFVFDFYSMTISIFFFSFKFHLSISLFFISFFYIWLLFRSVNHK